MRLVLSMCLLMLCASAAELRIRVTDENGKPVKAFDHGVDAIRYLLWILRYE